MKSKVQKWGNSLALRIPKSFAEDAKVKDGSAVELTFKEGSLVIWPIKTPSTLKALCAQVTPENSHHETDTGKKQGGEYW